MERTPAYSFLRGSNFCTRVTIKIFPQEVTTMENMDTLLLHFILESRSKCCSYLDFANTLAITEENKEGYLANGLACRQ